MPDPSAVRRRSVHRFVLARAIALSLLALASGCVHRRARPQPVAPPVYLLEAGARIRVTAPSLGATQRIGHFIAVRGDTLSMRGDQTLDSLAFPVRDIQLLEVSTWHGSRTMLGLQIGGAAGLAGGALLATACKSTSGGSCSSGRRSIIALGGAAIGAGVGALVGQYYSKEQWAAVPLSAAPRGAR